MWFIAKPSRLEDVMPGWINVADRGIIGDGSTDVSAKLSKLIQEVADKGGGTIYFPPGVYYSSETINVLGRVHLRGAGKGRVTFTGTEGWNIFSVIGTNSTISDMTIKSAGISISAGYSNYGYGVRIERVDFLDLAGETYLYVYQGGAYGQPFSTPTVIRDCRFIISNYPAFGTLYLAGTTSEVIIEDCLFETLSGITNTHAIYIESSKAIVRGCNWYSKGGSNTFISVADGDVAIDGITVKGDDVSGAMYTMLNIMDDFSKVVIGKRILDVPANKFIEFYGYLEQIIDLSAMLYRVRNPDGAVLSLPTRRSTNSTTYVTLKKFTSNVVGEIRVYCDVDNYPPGRTSYLRIQKNGSTVFEQSWYDGPATIGPVDIPVTIRDLIEIQVRNGDSTTAYLNGVRVYHIPYRANDFTNVVD